MLLLLDLAVSMLVAVADFSLDSFAFGFTVLMILGIVSASLMIANYILSFRLRSDKYKDTVLFFVSYLHYDTVLINGDTVPCMTSLAYLPGAFHIFAGGFWSHYS